MGEDLKESEIEFLESEIEFLKTKYISIGLSDREIRKRIDLHFLWKPLNSSYN